MTLAGALRDAKTIGVPPTIEITGLEYDSRKVAPGTAFFAFPGEIVDGHRYIPQAVERGAVAVVSERSPDESYGVAWAQVEYGRQALATAAREFYGRPDASLKLIGVTGTNGKTTTVYLIDSILRQTGLTTGRLGTIEHRIGARAVPAINTTPESLDVVRMLRELVDLGGSHASLEVSSHALEIGRIHGLEFHTGVFTNLSQDHLDFHGNMEAYARSKRRLFEGAGARSPLHGVVNIDDEIGRQFARLDGFEAITYAVDRDAKLRAQEVRSDFEGLRFDVQVDRQQKIPIRSSLLGLFNAYNILAAVGVGLACEIPPEQITAGVEACQGVPGRFETVREGQEFLVVVDYAHTDNALENLIRSARVLAGEGGRIITLFGCGGDRDRKKRPLMGEVAGRLSDCVILTSDNPRTEDPLSIIADAEIGLQLVKANYSTAPDREAAIHQALSEAAPGDVVLLAGKGHETYQEVGRARRPFDDRETARQVLQSMRRGRVQT